jgi:Glycoside hydrolase family 2 C-terminal domain 5
MITFSLSGASARIVGLGNSDNATFESEQGIQRSAFDGWAAVLIQSGTETGVIESTARCGGLEKASVEIVVDKEVVPHEVYVARDEREGPGRSHRVINVSGEAKI